MKRVVMIGTDPRTHGGISTVVRTWAEHGLFERWPVEYIATHRDGTKLEKLFAAMAGLLRFGWLILSQRAAILHVHGASRASFWRKLPFMALAHVAGWSVVFHLHGGGFKRFYQRGCGPIGRRLVRYCLDNAAAIVVVSERWARWVREVTPNRSITC